MKRIITLLSTMLLAITIIFAQQQQTTVPPPPSHLHLVTLDANSHLPSSMGRVRSNSSRANNSRAVSLCDTIQLDYGFYDQTVATNLGLNFNGGSGATSLLADVMTAYTGNPGIDSLHVAYKTYVEGVYDSVAYVDNNGFPAYIPLGQSSIFLDSVAMLLGIHGNAANMLNDSLIFTIFSVTTNASGQETETPVNTIVITDTANLAQFMAAANHIAYAQIPIKQQFTQGQGFAIRLDYRNKDTATQMFYIYSYADSCGLVTVTASNGQQGQLTTAYPSSLGVITYWGAIFGGGATILNAPYTVYDQNNNFGYFNYNASPNFIPVNCLYEPIQNLFMFPIIDVCTNYTVTIAADNPKACPGTVVNLSGSVFGTNTASTDLTYNWSTTSGSLGVAGIGTSTNQLFMGDSAYVTVTLVVTDPDNNNAVTVDSIIITNAGPKLAIKNSNNFSIACNQSSALVASLSGSTPISEQGVVYQWSSGATALDLVINNQSANLTQPYLYAGNYSVTVTNKWTCSATAAATVSYSNGVTNNVSFASRSFPIYALCPTVYVNNSSATASPWTSTIDLDNTGNLLTAVSGVDTFLPYEYPAQGNYIVTLIMDSAGCRFADAQTEVVKPVNKACTVGIGNITFDNNISLIPNPSNGNVSLQVNGVDKGLTVLVYNVLGAEVKSFSASDATGTFTKTFDFSDLASGAYLVKIQSGENTAIKKMLISR